MCITESVASSGLLGLPGLPGQCTASSICVAGSFALLAQSRSRVGCATGSVLPPVPSRCQSNSHPRAAREVACWSALHPCPPHTHAHTYTHILKRTHTRCVGFHAGACGSLEGGSSVAVPTVCHRAAASLAAAVGNNPLCLFNPPLRLLKRWGGSLMASHVRGLLPRRVNILFVAPALWVWRPGPSSFEQVGSRHQPFWLFCFPLWEVNIPCG